MKKALEVWAVEAIRKGKWNLLTAPLSWCYARAIQSRHWLYDNRWCVPKQAPLPVVSVGNLVVGGVGKTQVAMLLAEALEGAAILSRGYRGKIKKKPLLVSTESHTAEKCGDEPWLLASRLPKTKVIVDHDRYRSALEAEKLGARLLILDDGMQHRRLFRDFEIVVLNGSDPFGGAHFLPRGLLREDPKRLARADLVVFVGKPGAGVEEKVARLTEAPSVETAICVKRLCTLSGELLPSIEGKKVGLFCGIGHPSRFASSIKEKGADIVAAHYLPDHKAIGKEELQTFATLCKKRGAEYLLCTEKDKVKLPSFALSSPLPVGWVEVELEIMKNREAWDRMVKEMTYLAGMR